MIRIWKVGARDCPICSEMAAYDRSEIRRCNAYYRYLELDDVPNHRPLMDYLKAEVVSDDGTINIPVYVVEWRGSFLGYAQGQMSRQELRDQFNEALKRRTQ